MRDIESASITRWARAEFIYNMLLQLTEEDIDEVENIIEAVAKIHCRICDFTSWTIYSQPAEDDE